LLHRRGHSADRYLRFCLEANAATSIETRCCRRGYFGAVGGGRLRLVERLVRQSIQITQTRGNSNCSVSLITKSRLESPSWRTASSRRIPHLHRKRTTAFGAGIEPSRET